MTRWAVIGLSLAGGILIGLASGHFMPCYGARHAEITPYQIVVTHITREGRYVGRPQTHMYKSLHDCMVARNHLMGQMFKAAASGYKGGARARCFAI